MNKKTRSSARSIQPVVKISSLDQQESDFQYWQSRSFSERLAAFEEIRTEYHRWSEDAQQGLQRVYTIIKR